MVICKQCDTSNPLDSRFCRKCGVEIPADDLSRARDEVEKLVAEGFKLFGENRTDEARLVAERALQDDPTHTGALSLKGMCHERAGELAEALNAFEKVVELKPDSALDRIKVTHLRQTLSTKLQESAEPDRRVALLGGVAAVVLVVALGVAVAMMNPRGPSAGTEQPTTVAQRDLPQSPISAFENPPTGSGGTGGDATQGSQNPTPSPDPNSAATPSPAPNVGTGLPPAPRLPNANLRPNGGLPNVNGAPEQVRPFQPALPEDLQVVPEVPSARPSSPPDEVEPTVQGGPTATPAQTPRVEAPRGEMTIRVTEPPRGVGSTPAGNANEAEALVRAARNQLQLGQYDRAAASLRRALSAGADPAATNQRLGQALERMGRRDEAASAYQRSISAFESALRSGGGDRERLQTGLESARAALRAIQGN